MVRPQYLRLEKLPDQPDSGDGSGHHSMIHGDIVRVISSVFHGDHRECEVKSASSSTILVLESDPDLDRINNEGDWARYLSTYHEHGCCPQSKSAR